MINRTVLIGNTGKDPDIRTTGSGYKVAKFSLATTEHFKDKQGNKQTETQWHSIVAWGPLADICEKYIKKGQMLYIDGKIQYGTYDDKDGNKKYYTEIVASNIQMLGGRKQDDVAIRAEPQGDRTDDLPWQ